MCGNGELSILQNPASIDFKGSEKLDSESISSVLLASLGYSVAHPSGWSGLYINEPFNLPKSIVAVVIEGVEQLKIQQGKHSEYAILGSSSGSSIEHLVETIQEHGRVIDIDLNEGYDGLSQYNNIFGKIIAQAPSKKTLSLKPKSHPEDKLFLQQLDIISNIASKLEEVVPKPELILLRVSLKNILSAHGIGTPPAIEAIDFLSNAIEELNLAVETSYDNNVVVAVVASNDELRLKREVREKREVPSTNIVS